ncbi:carbohydrate ABC transporter permease [Thermobacillus sp. ZCTH02-B1]|uniref:carbohydrate ABC transporter permease n=1 Tax=Thermobacillus sp. ZCTH02-B1 TaxID=1858795 RepID=UPI0025D216EB|nr:carbohydrate ABC transporter permease [Thermobacillus sp. ZCTH02-B1]
MKSKWIDGFMYTVLGFASLFFITPLLYVVLTSFKTENEIFRVPQSLLPDALYTGNYEAIFKASNSFLRYFANSTIITVTGVFIVLVLSALAGYGFARLPFRGSGVMLAAILMTITIPLAVFLVPIYLMEDAWGILNTNLGLILPNVAVVLPFAIFIMRANYIGIPKELEEAALIDGCGIFRTWWNIMLPLVKNGSVIVIIHAFYNIWGEYTLAKSLATKPDAMPLTVGLTLFKGEVWAFGMLSSVIVLSMLPPIIIFLIFQKQLIEGISQGAVKG